MNFNSWQFLIFLPIVVLLYWILPKKFRWVMLLISSYIFYMCWNPWLIFLIVFTTAVSYISGLLMEKYDSKKVKKACMVVTVVSCIFGEFCHKSNQSQRAKRSRIFDESHSSHRHIILYFSDAVLRYRRLSREN